MLMLSYTPFGADCLNIGGKGEYEHVMFESYSYNFLTRLMTKSMYEYNYATTYII